MNARYGALRCSKWVTSTSYRVAAVRARVAQHRSLSSRLEKLSESVEAQICLVEDRA
jgi:hypothetical protein